MNKKKLKSYFVKKLLKGYKTFIKIIYESRSFSRRMYKFKYILQYDMSNLFSL